MYREGPILSHYLFRKYNIFGEPNFKLEKYTKLYN